MWKATSLSARYRSKLRLYKGRQLGGFRGQQSRPELHLYCTKAPTDPGGPPLIYLVYRLHEEGMRDAYADGLAFETPGVAPVHIPNPNCQACERDPLRYLSYQ